MTLAPQTAITHRSVLAIAVPIMLSNVTEPLIGVVNTAVIGQLPDAYYIGAIALGSLIFSFVYWGFGFLRMGTGGLSAQATGANDGPELVAVLVRALILAVICGLALIALSPLIGAFAFRLLEGSPAVERHAAVYFYIRIFSAPFALSNFCLLGWFIGQGRAKTGFLIQIYLNLTNMVLDVLFVLGFGMTSDGVALGALIAEVTAALLGLALALRHLRHLAIAIEWPRVLDTAKLWRTLAINRDIMIRTVCLVFAFSWFTARGAKAGDLIIAANAVLMNFFEVAAFLIDGFAFASEALVGQAVGAGNRRRFNDAIRLTSIWAGAVGVLTTLVILAGGSWFIDLMTVNPEVRETARHYLFWAALAPLVGTVCFQFDGIFTGATATADMRNMMIVSLAIYLAAWWWLEPAFGNHGLWAAMIVFFAARGVTFWMRMPALERKAFS
jgi:MATE family multidrug resistance protein